MANLPKKLLLLTHEFPPFRGGVSTYCERVAVAAGQYGVSVTVVAPGFGKKTPNEKPAPNVSVKRFPGGIFSHWQFPFVLLITLWQIIKLKESTVLAADWPFVAACGLVRRVLPFRYTIMLHGSEILFFRRSRLLNAITLGNPFFGAEVICVNSNFTSDLLFQSYPRIPKAKVRVTYLGVDRFWFTKPKKFEAVLSKLGIPAGRKIVLSVGRIHPRKGQARCIAAMSRLDPKIRDQICYVIVGQAVDEGYARELRDLADKVSFPVIFSGVVSDVELLQLYRHSALFCLPSQTHGTKVEGFGLVFLEAAGSALPSIASNAGAVPEVVQTNRTGILVEPDNEEKLTEALQIMLSNPELRRSFGSAAAAWAESFTWLRCVESTLGSKAPSATCDAPRLCC